MGTQARTNRILVEDCRSLSVATLVSSRVIPHSANSTGIPQPILWASDFEVRAQYQENWNGEGKLTLAYTIRGMRIDDEIEVTSIPSPLGHGRRRYYFRCPGLDQAACGKRLGKLYLPPSENHFACRTCHDLTYRSCKEHSKRLDRFLRMSPGAISHALDSPDPMTRLLAIKAAIQIRSAASKG